MSGKSKSVPIEDLQRAVRMYPTVAIAAKALKTSPTTIRVWFQKVELEFPKKWELNKLRKVNFRQ